MISSSRNSSMFVAALAIGVFGPIAVARASEPFHAGDSFVVAQQGVPLMIGSKMLATLSQGQRLNVLQTQGDWVGTSIVINGRKIGGWVWRGQVVNPSQYAQRRTVRGRYSYQPKAYYGRGYRHSSNPLDEALAGRRLIMGYTPYGPAYWRADRKIVGY